MLSARSQRPPPKHDIKIKKIIVQTPNTKHQTSNTSTHRASNNKK